LSHAAYEITIITILFFRICQGIRKIKIRKRKNPEKKNPENPQKEKLGQEIQLLQSYFFSGFLDNTGFSTEIVTE